MKPLIFMIILALTAATTTVVYHKTQSADIAYFKAHRYFDRGKYEEAIPLYKKALAIKGPDIDSLKDLAYSYQYTGRHQEALATFLTLLPYTPQDAGIKKAVAETYSWTKNYRKAITFYEDVLKTTGDADAALKLAEVFLWDNQYDKAIELSRAILEKDPQNAKAKLILAKALHFSGKAEEAAKLYREVLRDAAIRFDSRDEENIQKLLGEASMIAKDYPGSIKEYRDVLKKNPEDAGARLALADILSWEQRYDESITEYLKILREEPGDLRTKEKLANVYLWNKDYANAEKLFKEILRDHPDDQNIEAMTGQILTWQGKYPESIGYFEGILAKAPDNLAAAEDLGDVLSYTGEFPRAISLYRKILAAKKDTAVKRKLARVLSWVRQYGESVKLYNELLADKEDAAVRLEKARVLGWAKDYDNSLKEYRTILSNGYDAAVWLEMNAKAAYWNNRVIKAIRFYKDLLEQNSRDTEAMFDLSQIYAHNRMWKDAITAFKRILAVEPGHYRAQKGLEKTELVSNHLLWKNGYEFTEADSQSRDMDIRKHTVFNTFGYPVNGNLNIGAVYNVTDRMFADFSDVIENRARILLQYADNPYGWAEGFYDIIAYNKDISAIHTFGGAAAIRLVDLGTFAFKYERERLENSSTVIRNHYYGDGLKERIDIDLTNRLKIGADCLYEHYSDSNERFEPGFDARYYFSLDPLRLSATYRYFFREFKNKVPEYFSPKGFTTNTVEFDWRHYLNKEEIFFGADDIYYEAGYAVSVDSQSIVSHRFSGELNWDVNKRLNLNVRGSFTNTSCSVYRDSDIIFSLKYYF
ncbi:MAG: tetratricopeptide repeat protein [Candidatus Omnitrophica bacterium]|nr:tetratricopeptide repeat protein [Candidatus Omnitrophota bacterium]